MKRNLRTFVPLAVVLILGCHALSVAASAIPMWEFLSRDEKMSYLYRVFSQQVTQFCGDSSMPDCNKNLLVSGLRNLANMDDSALDKLDPYQRGAKEITTSDSDTNGIADETMVVHDYIRPSEHTGPYLVGPMVIRVYPDGRPVPEDTTRPLPRDEDVEEFKHPRLPSIEEVQVNRDTTYREKQSKGNSFPETKSHQRSYEESVHPRNDYPPFKRRLFQEVIAKRKLHYY
ncbi:rhythmically expressed gene 5 protein isoform X4 [Ceratina calcarata]|uniref:Rhythmically expressed gene 5 protein isoform X4 n=1 Tax=Ceratina calcarata TaxID=156304 RepID=A0AAJ7SDJ0_9HYME|nr:rhythmically expressed gene 5 protein isoform X4 [Ceratina calcarata]